MQVSVKFFCTCDACVQQNIFIDDSEELQPNEVEHSQEPIVCDECNKIHEVYIIRDPKQVLISMTDVDDFSHKVI